MPWPLRRLESDTDDRSSPISRSQELRICCSPSSISSVDVAGIPFRRLLQGQLGFALMPAEGSKT